MNEHYELIEKTAEMPEGTDFCLIMNTDEMEPVIAKGERMYISRRESPEMLEVGIFYHKGRIYCRQYCEDYSGALLLLCANPLRENENLILDKEQKKGCICLGRVLLKTKPPMPLYV